MNKRILAAMLAVMMMLSMFVLAGCNTENNESGDESSKELTTKELFEASIKNLFAGAEEYKEFTQKSGTGELNVNVDKLVFGEMDLTQLGKISLTGETVTDGKNTNIKYSLSAFGETMPAEMTVQNDGEIYFVDFFGLNDKAIKIEMPEVDESEGAAAGVSDAMTKAPAIVEHVMKSVETVIGANIVEDDFSAEDKDVTVLGTEFKGAKVITLTVSDEKIAKIATELVDALRENEDVKKLFSDDFNKAEFAEDIKDIKGLRVVNTVVDEKSVALAVYLDAMEEKEADLENSGDASETSDAEVEKEQKTFGIDIACVEKNFSLEMGFINDAKEFVKEDGILSLTIKDDGSKLDVSFKMTEENEVNEMLTVKADITDGKYDGTITLNSDNSVIEINYTAKGDKSEGEFGIDGIKLTQIDYEGEETTQTIPLTLAASYKNEETKMTAQGTLTLAIEEAAEIEASFDMVSEYKDATVETVTDSVPMDEFDMESAMGEFATKYPTIYSFVGMLGGSQGNEDETYFEKDGLGLWLPSDFSEMQADGFNGAYTNSELMVLTVKDSYDNYTDYEEFTFDDYVNAVYVNYLVANPTEISYDDYGTPYFEYCAEGYGYYVTILEGYDAYWLILCACEESALDDNRATFAEWILYSDPYADAAFDEDI